MTAIYLYDDARARTFEPFASTRPMAEMLAGTALIRERWRMAVAPSADSVFHVSGPRHADFDEPNASRSAHGAIPPGSIIVNARCAPAMPKDFASAERRAAPCSMWRSGNELAAVRIKEPIDSAKFADGSMTLDSIASGTGAVGDVGGWWLNHVWDFVGQLQETLTQDIERIAAHPAFRRAEVPAHATVIGNAPVVIAEGAVIERHVVFDTSTGPILIQNAAHVRAFTRISGPCYIGEHANVMGGDITGCAIGEHSKIRGEISSTVVLGYSNKGHEGFVGHSYLGRWVNLGAGTVTSNLKNTYGTVALWTPAGTRDTGLQFLGTMFGDHVKTGIGLCLTTGTVLGAGANVYEHMPPKVVSPFSWGAEPPYDVYRVDKFVETAERMMARRHVKLSDRARRHLASVHAGRWTATTDAT